MDNFAHKSITAVILAAGKGTRMHSDKPKAMQTLLGEPMLYYTLSAARSLFDQNVVIVTGFKGEKIENVFSGENFVRQSEQLGTGHAVMCALTHPLVEKAEYLLVVNADSPLLTANILSKFIVDSLGADISFATITLKDPASYGRVVRRDGKIQAIVEAKDYDPAIYGSDVGEVNAGIYFFKKDILKKLLPLLNNHNKSGEYYLTDLISLGLQNSFEVLGIQCGDNPALLGVNSPRELYQAEEYLKEKIISDLLNSGVILHSPHLLYASPRAQIEAGVEIFCPCEIYGKSEIRRGSVVETHCVIKDSILMENVLVHSFSHIDTAIIGSGAQVGPYCRLRPGAELKNGAHVGNFVELKKTVLGVNSKANHLSYLGDSEIGDNVNIGAGTITCNYDGKNKHKTIIGDGAFIGSNTAIVAPLEIGKDVLVGAGSVLTTNVPDRTLAVGRSKQKNLRVGEYKK